MQGFTMTQHHARDYQRNRYRSIDQAWVNWCEQRLIARLLTRCRLAGGSLLDVPCGYGRFFPIFARLGMTATGVDVSQEMVQLAQQHEPLSSSAHVLCGTIFDLPFADNSFDAVLCIRLLHHHYSDADRHRIFCELTRVSCRVVLVSFYRYTHLHAWAPRGKRRLPASLTETELSMLAWTSDLKLEATYSLLRYGHMQTFAVFRKISSAALESRERSAWSHF